MPSNSAEWFTEAQKYIPGGVNSPVRAFKSVGGQPRFIERAQGSRIYDVEGREYIDYVCSWGPMILGHAHPQIVAAIQAAVALGTSYGAPTTLEVELARMIAEIVPSIEKVRLVSSGTEAVMSAIRLARGYTGRDKILKFDGCYHGHGDSLLVKAGSGLATLGVPDSAGIPAALAQLTLTLPYNDLAAVEELCLRVGKELACIIVEPVAGNRGVVLPEPGYLEGLCRVTKDYGILLIFDEVITGFRVALGGAQEFYGVRPDLTCLGKIIGGGLPVGAYGGRAEIMDRISPLGPVYQAGTLSGNPLAVTAGIETLKLLKRPGFYAELEQKSARLAEGISDCARRHKVDIYTCRRGSLMSTYFTRQPVRDYASAKTSSVEKFNKFFWSLQEQGINIAPSQFEAMFVSQAHSDSDLMQTIAAVDKAMALI